MSDTHPRHYAMWASYKVHDGGPDHLRDVEYSVNCDGSIWVTSWDDLAAWQAYLGPYDQESAHLTLLFAARGNIREVGPEERDAIALEYGEQRPRVET